MGPDWSNALDLKRVFTEKIGDFCDFYVAQVLSQPTRSITLFGRKCHTQLLGTFLGFELKVGKKRITCPDSTTARYLKIFAEMGMSSVEIPYDPSVTQRLLPHLEESWHDIRALLGDDPPQQNSRQVRDGYRRLRDRLKLAGRLPCR